VHLDDRNAVLWIVFAYGQVDPYDGVHVWVFRMRRFSGSQRNVLQKPQIAFPMLSKTCEAKTIASASDEFLINAATRRALVGATKLGFVVQSAILFMRLRAGAATSSQVSSESRRSI
jgi:hypothetical protein